jgi:hypothetical protein
MTSRKKKNTPKTRLISFYSQCWDLKYAILGFIPDFGWTIIVVCVVDTICPHFFYPKLNIFYGFFFLLFFCQNLTFKVFRKFRQNNSILFQIGNSKTPSKSTHTIQKCHYPDAQIRSESFCRLTTIDIEFIPLKSDIIRKKFPKFSEDKKFFPNKKK